LVVGGLGISANRNTLFSGGRSIEEKGVVWEEPRQIYDGCVCFRHVALLSGPIVGMDSNVSCARYGAMTPNKSPQSDGCAAAGLNR
jgi:hypothetical protein